MALFLDRLKILWVQEWLDSFTIVLRMSGATPNIVKTFKNYLLNEQKYRGSILDSIYLVILVSPFEKVEGDGWLGYAVC